MLFIYVYFLTLLWSSVPCFQILACLDQCTYNFEGLCSFVGSISYLFFFLSIPLFWPIYFFPSYVVSYFLVKLSRSLCHVFFLHPPCPQLSPSESQHMPILHVSFYSPLLAHVFIFLMSSK